MARKITGRNLFGEISTLVHPFFKPVLQLQIRSCQESDHLEGRWDQIVNSDMFVTASAGTGKTYTLVKEYVGVFERAFRLGEQLDVHNVVAITFTNKAAREMKDRVISEFDLRISHGEPGSGSS